MDWEVRAVFLWLILGVLGTIQDGAAEKKVVCYYTNWSIYRPGTAKFSPQNINPYLCTHLIYAFGGFTKDNTLKPFDKYQDIEKGGYAKFTGLKTYNKNLKTMLAIGGWNEGSSRFSPMVADPARRRELVKNSVKFLRQNHFDGLDLDWEYPAFRDGGKPRDKDNYANLVQELREEFERESSKTGRPRLLLSMAMPAGIEYIDKGYDVPRLNEYLDFINLLSYDYHSAFEPAVNHHAPLYPLEEDNEYNFDSELTIDYTINHLVKSGASPEKIILGIPTYGRSYTLFNEDATELGSPADGPGVEGDATREKGYLAYYEICESLIDSDDWEVVQPNPKAMGPYAFKGNQWVGYDDVDIVKLKARYVNEKNLGGIMFWSIDNDDFRGKCHNRPYPLIEAAKEALLIEDTRSTGQKTKQISNRKKLRGQSTSSNTLTRRKAGASNRRTTTTLAPVTRKPVVSSKPKYRVVSRTSYSEEEEEDRELDRRSYDPASVEEENENDSKVKSSNKNTRKRLRNRNKSRGQSSNGRRKKPSRNEEANENDTDTANEESLGNKLTTPEPPTTPDPGTDFKCEDEGFFSHPRDCKKYFWCLESGPGGLGIVAHQFTCPSGLVFNKGADSCDYPRNVVCPKAKTSQSSPSTTRAPITAATSRTTYLHSTTQRTTTAKSDSEEEYEYYDDEEELDDAEEEEEDKLEPRITSTAKPLQYKTISRNKPTVATTTTTTTPKPEKEEQDKSSDLADEEDPKVIKELINLIRKAGGIEELEKQLSIQEKGSSAASSNDPVTPATISRTLYERVLSRQAGKIIAGNTSGSSERGSYKNGPGRTQFEGLDEVPEVKSLRRAQKPQYVTIERPKASTNAPDVEDEGEDDEEELDDYNANVASAEDETISNPSEISTSTQRVTPNYVNIRRNRFSTTTVRNENDVEEKKDDGEERNPLRRHRPNGSNKNQDKESEEASKPSRTRTRYRVTEEQTESVNSEEKPAQKTRQTDESNTATTKSRYINIQRFRSTTPRLVEDSAKDNVDDAKIVEVTTEIPIIKSKINVEEEITTTSASPATSTTVESTTPLATPTTTPLTTFSQSTSSSVSSTLLYLPSSTSTSTEVTVRVEATEDTSIPNILGDNVNSVSSTTDSVKLVEDSATEILLTTAPASSSPPTTSVQTSTRVVATVSQPRPFGFTRRRSGSVTPEVTTTPIAPSSERSRPKVSITSRNSTRSSSYLVGRGRLRSRPDPGTRVTGNKRITEQEQLENPPTSEETFNKSRDGTASRSRPSNKRRGVSRYTPPTISPIAEDVPKNNNLSRRRNRTTEAPITTTSVTTENASPRRRYRRPSSTQTQSTTEGTRANELEDSPIVRITQGYPSRGKKFRSKSEINVEKEDEEKITNIRVYKQPSINKELYGRPRNAIKRNYVDVEQISRRTSEPVETKKETPVHSSVATTSTTKVEQGESTTVSSIEIVNSTENDSSNTIDGGFTESSIPSITEFEENSTTVKSELESDTTMSTYATEVTTDANIVSTDSNVSYETSESSEEMFTTQNILVEITSPVYKSTEVSEIVQNETIIDTVSSAERKGQRRVKVVRRRRPVTPSTTTSSTTSSTTSTTTVQPEENGKYQVIRRRKVLKRVRPLNHTSSTASLETSSQEDEQNSSRYESLAETTTELQSGELRESENATEGVPTFATEFQNSIDYTLSDRLINSKLETTTESMESAKDEDSDLTTSPITIIDGAITEALTLLITESTIPESDDLYSTVMTTESTVTPPSTFVENTFAPEEIRLSTENVTASVQTTTPLTTRDSDESYAYSKSSPSESRYVRKKFIRRRPIVSPETPNSRYTLISRPNRVFSTTERNELEVNQLSKRRKNLFIRRRPVSSTVRTTESLYFEDQNETEDVVEQEEQEDIQETTAKATISSASLENESLEFWKHYTSAAEQEFNQKTSPPDNFRTTYLTTDEPVTIYPTTIRDGQEVLEKEDSKIAGNINKPQYVTINRRPESRQAYVVPNSLKSSDKVQERASSTENTLLPRRWYPIDDSSPEETEEKPETNEARSRVSGYRQPRTRYRNYEERLSKDRSNKETASNVYSYVESSTSSLKSRYQTKRLSTPVEIPVTETLIPAKKFDYAADAFFRKQQSLRTTTPQQPEDVTASLRYQNEENSELQNLVDLDHTTTPSAKPQITRLVTSIAESGTTERQKILIKTKYSSLTATTRIPVQNVIARTTTPSPKTSIESSNRGTLDESINEIRPSVETSTLPIESEFIYRGNGRFTTESHESSTIPIESVFSNLIASAKDH